MPNPVEALVLDLLEWLAREPRGDSEVMEVWRTSCPRLPVWEDANLRGFVERRHRVGQEAQVGVSAAGLAYLEAHRGAVHRRMDRRPSEPVPVALRDDA